MCAHRSSPSINGSGCVLRDLNPRISFSHDLKEAVESHPSLLLNPTIDFHFDFCIHQTLISSADELFVNSKILPVQIKTPPKPPSNDVVQEDTTKKKRLFLFERATIEDDLFLFQPLLQEKLVGWGFCDLV